MPDQLTRLIKEEAKVDVRVRVVGKTLWVFLPMENMVNGKTGTWEPKSLEKFNDVMNTIHRVMLSSDAPIDFIAFVAADIKKFGVQFLVIDYLQDLKEAVLERFSRGEFFMRSVRDISFDPMLIGDTLGENIDYHDITFGEFISLQIIHRTKNLFARNKTLDSLFDLKTTSWEEKFGILKIELEFIRKRYDLNPQEEKIKPLDEVVMVAAQTFHNYDFKDIQAVELTDTFADETKKLTLADLEKVKVTLPEYSDSE